MSGPSPITVSSAVNGVIHMALLNIFRRMHLREQAVDPRSLISAQYDRFLGDHPLDRGQVNKSAVVRIDLVAEVL